MTSPQCNFTGKVVIVTGGGSGIGLAIARAFAAKGANLAIAGRDRERLTRAAATLEREAGRPVLATHADIARPEDCEAMVEAAANRFGALDILVNNAAHFALAPLLDATGEEALRFFGPNLFGPLQ